MIWKIKGFLYDADASEHTCPFHPQDRIPISVLYIISLLLIEGTISKYYTENMISQFNQFDQNWSN